jgi:DNA-directed RNA polymerase subunit K/omega
MRVFTPGEITAGAANKYLAVLIAAKYARVLNEFPRMGSGKEKKLTTRALEEIAQPESIAYRVVPRKRPTE